MSKKISALALTIFLLITVTGCSYIGDMTEDVVVLNTANDIENADDVPSDTESKTETGYEAESEGADEITEGSSEPMETEETDIGEYEPDEDWALYIIGNDNPLPKDFYIVTKPVQGQRELDVRCADYAIAMIQAAAEDGIRLKVSSAYRSVEKQQENIDMYIEWYMSMGDSYEEAYNRTYSQVAIPGCSEHNAGLAMDIESEDYFDTHTELETDFDTTPEFDWLYKNAHKFGFIMSFPKGKEDLTGFPYEPWHYRYVGIEHATEIYEEGITLYEYIESRA